MNGEPEPPSDGNTGGVGWIIEDKKPEVLRTLLMDFRQDIAPLFPDEAFGLTPHEIAELEALDLWFDWTEPPRPGEFGPEPDEDGEDGGGRPARKSGGNGGAKRGLSGGQRRDSVTSARQALEAIRHLTDA